MIEFLYPERFIVLVLIVFILLVFILWREGVRKQRINKIEQKQLAQYLAGSVVYSKRRFKHFLWLGAISCLILALTHPSWGLDSSIEQVEAQHVIWMVDLSLSMNAQDEVPSRLDRAKLDMMVALQQLPTGTRHSLIIFAKEAYLVLVSSFDYLLVGDYFERLQTEGSSLQGTSIANALALGLKIDDPLATFVLLSDGEDHTGNLEGVLEEVIQHGTPIISLSYGSVEGALIPILNEQNEIIDYKTDAQGEMVFSQAKPDLLQKLSEQTKGSSLNTQNSLALANIIQEIGRKQAYAQQQNHLIDRYGIFVILAMMALLASLFINESTQDI